jgi:hypothetical protein
MGYQGHFPGFHQATGSSQAGHYYSHVKTIVLGGEYKYPLTKYASTKAVFITRRTKPVLPLKSSLEVISELLEGWANEMTRIAISSSLSHCYRGYRKMLIDFAKRFTNFDVVCKILRAVRQSIYLRLPTSCYFALVLMIYTT